MPQPVGHTISPVQRQMLARAVAGTTEQFFTLNPDNTRRRLYDKRHLDECLDADDCLVVTVRPELLAVDFDRTPLDQIDEFIAALEASALKPVVLASGGEGRRHVWVRTNDAAWTTQAKRIGGDVRHQIRPPGVRHRTGVAPVLLNVTATEALRRLRRVKGQAATGPKSAAVRPVAALDRNGLRLPLPDPSGYLSNSEAVRAAACRYQARGGLPGDLVQAMDDCTWAPWMTRLAESGRSRTVRWLLRWVWPTEPVETVEVCDDDLVEATVAAAHARARAEIVGRSAPATMRVLDLIIDRARQHRTLTIGLSLRQAVEGAGVAMATAHKALRRLREAGVIERVTMGRGGRGGTLSASEWRIVGDGLTEGRALRTPPGTPPAPPPAPTCLPAHDLLSGAGLGHAALDVYSRILNLGGRTSLAELCASSGQPSGRRISLKRRSRNISRHLALLAGVGLIALDGDSVAAVNEPDLDAAAALRDTHSAWRVVGRIAIHQARHAHQRQSYVEYRADTAHREWAG